MTKARGFLHQLVSFEFLLTFMRILSSLRFLTVMLQKKSNDILTYQHVSKVLMDLELLTTNCEDEFHLWFNEIKILADSLNIAINTPRTTSRQVHRSNAAADSPETSYRRNIMTPFLNYIITEFEQRFGPVQQTKIKLLGFVDGKANIPQCLLTKGQIHLEEHCCPVKQKIIPTFLCYSS